MIVLNKISILVFLLITQLTYGQKQKAFIGMLEYKIYARDTNLRSIIPNNESMIYTNDTITRTENFTNQLGKQVVIHHMEKNKSYLLLDTPIGKFAIQTDHAHSDTIQKESPYSFKKKFFKRKILGLKANRMIVSHPEFEEPIEFLYLKKVQNKYITTFPEIPGLLVKYSLPTADGVINYELIKMSRYHPLKDLFGIPSDFERVSFDEFLERMIESKQPKSESDN